MMIDIDHVSFQYSGAEQENLQDFNLQIKKGECVVLTGESGCGKTCVTRLINTLIPHFYEGEMSGAVLIDGVDTRTIQPHDLSDKIGSVFQNPRSQFFSLDTDSEIVFGMENKGMPYQVMLNRYQQTIRELHIYTYWIDNKRGANRFRLFQTMYSVMSGLGTHHEDVASKEDALLLLRYVEDCLLWCFRKGVNC